MNDAVILLQARTASVRLPRKALARIGSKTVLAACLERLAISGVAPVMLATTDRAEDDCLADLAAFRDVPVFRGPDSDVLARFVLAAEAAGARHVVRATGDNPCVDIEAPRRVLTALETRGVDYVREDDLPYGAGVEAITADALRRAAAVVRDREDREHVTTFVRRDPRFTRAVLMPPAELRRPDVRLTIDTAEDLEYVRRLFAKLGHPAGQPELAAFIAAADAIAEPFVASGFSRKSVTPDFRLKAEATNEASQ